MTRHRLALLNAFILLAASSLAAGKPAQAAPVPAPRDVLGFTPGEDRRLASWEKTVAYFQSLDRASDRVVVREVGKTTLGRPFLLAILSAPENLRRLDRYREIQRRLADPRTLGVAAEARRLIGEGKTVVLITCGIHSTEVGANLVAPNIAYRLATDDSPETRRIRENCIVLLVPSLNPDGVDIVKSWYDRTLGTPGEGTGPPELYHHYTGHDNNRDWYAFTQVETQLTVDNIHNVWRPQIVHDIHQQGSTGSRMFLPPYLEPWEPNVPPLIQAGVNFLGSAMAWELAAEGRAGVITYASYDAWTPARAYSHYHGGLRILSETASANLASPITLPLDRLSPRLRTRDWNFPLPWPGGTWGLRDIVGYMESGAFALLRNAALYRERWLESFYLVGEDAVRPRRDGEPFAYLLAPASRSHGVWRERGAARLAAILTRGGVELLSARRPFTADGVSYPAGTVIVPMAQPYGGFARALLERQTYPDLRLYPGGPPKPPYDVTAHSLSLLMGVPAARVDTPFPLPTGGERSATDLPARHPSPAQGVRLALYKSHAPSMDEGWTRWVFDDLKVAYTSLNDAEARAGGLRARYDCIVLPSQGASTFVNGLPAARYPAEVAGGLGAEGVAALQTFVAEGGTLITLNNACDFAIERLDVPVRNVLKGVSARDFYCPGSILKLRFDTAEPLARGVPQPEGRPGEGIAWFEDSPALEVTGDGARVIARYPDAKDVLLSGWLLGAEKIAGKAALVEATQGRGRVILFAFRPQYRGQSIATLPFLFNAIAASANP